MTIDNTKEYILNFGPHHPSTHGVLRLILKMQGETIKSCVADIGYLHRGVEKILENKKWLSITPFLDRLDYLAPLHTEHAYVIALESTLNIEVPERALYIRTIFDELTRIASHIMAIGCATHDIGMLSLFLYCFEEREKILKIFENTTGARMHLNYYVVGGLFNDITNNIIQQIMEFLSGIHEFLENVQVMALNNRIFKNRTVNIGTISKSMAVEYGLTGPNARASGLKTDIRQEKPYGAYRNISFETPTLDNGNCYDRFKIRYLEIIQSISIIQQCIKKLPDGPIHNHIVIQLLNNKSLMHNTPKEAIYSYFFENGLDLPKKLKIYRSVEGARGEIGIFISVESERSKPYRMHIRSPSFPHIQILEQLLIGTQIADVPSILGSLDFLMGDCDR